MSVCLRLAYYNNLRASQSPQWADNSYIHILHPVIKCRHVTLTSAISVLLRWIWVWSLCCIVSALAPYSSSITDRRVCFIVPIFSPSTAHIGCIDLKSNNRVGLRSSDIISIIFATKYDSVSLKTRQSARKHLTTQQRVNPENTSH